MSSSICACAQHYLPYAVVGVASVVIIFSGSFTYVFSSLLLTSVIILASVKLIPAPAKNETSSSSSSSSSELESDIDNTITQPEEQCEQVEADGEEAYSLSLLETESVGSVGSVDLSTTSEESDGQYAQSSMNSSDDGSISDEDEDSLIEIALYEGHYIIPRGESCFKPYSKLPSFRQQSLMELLAEINEMNENEEDNMIEIDLSMGSIKCSRIGIQA